MYEPERLTGGNLIDLRPVDNRHGLDAVQSLTNDLAFRHATLSGTELQHALVTRFDVDLLPNHR